jgi:hypothetical protein
MAQYLRGVMSQTRRGVDWDAFPNREDAVTWLNNHPASENPDDDILTPLIVQSPHFYQLLVSMIVMLAGCVAHRVLQGVYYSYCVMNTWYDAIYLPWMMFMPHCRAYQGWLVYLNDWFVVAFFALVSSFSVYIYLPLQTRFSEWTVFQTSLMPNIPE